MNAQPKTGRPCVCEIGIWRDNCAMCEGTGWEIDFKTIRKTKLTSDWLPVALSALRNLLEDHKRMFPDAHPNSTIAWDECEEVKAAKTAIAVINNLYEKETASRRASFA